MQCTDPPCPLDARTLYEVFHIVFMGLKAIKLIHIVSKNVAVRPVTVQWQFDHVFCLWPTREYCALLLLQIKEYHGKNEAGVRCCSYCLDRACPKNPAWVFRICSRCKTVAYCSTGIFLCYDYCLGISGLPLGEKAANFIFVTWGGVLKGSHHPLRVKQG